MKLRYIFTALAAAALAFVGCQEERFLDEVKVSQSIVSIPVEGDEVTITVNAQADWAFAESNLWPNVIEKDKDGNVTSTTKSWLTIEPATGSAGETTVKFKAEATTETRELTIALVCGNVQQNVKVVQMAEKVELPFTDCATVLAEKEVGQIYKVKGTVTDLTNYDKYGCFYVNDGTGTVYVYGSMNPTAFKPEVGDIISFEGPWTSYGNFDDVTILALEKSLIKLEKVFPAEALPLEGGVATALLTVKDGSVEVEIPEDAAWLTAGEPTALGSMVSVDLTAAPNEGGARKTTVTFKVTVNDKDYIAMADIEQLGAIAAVSVADFLAAAEGTALYSLTGTVKNLANTTYGNFDLVDGTGSVYVYGLTGNGAIGSNDKSFASLGINEGDVVTIVGTRAAYKGSPQVGGTAYLVEHVVAASVSTVADFLAQPVSGDKWFKLTGKVANMKSDVYGNFDLVDETGSVYVYGLTTAKVAKNDKSFANTGVKEGDIVTLVGTRAAYNGQDQVGGPAYYIFHEEGATIDWEAEGVATAVNGEEAADDALLKELKVIVDDANLYVRATATAALDGANFFDVSFCDGNGENTVWWGWTTTGANTYWKEHKGTVDAEGNLTEMKFSFNGEYQQIDVKTEKVGDDVVWYATYPREYVAAYEANGKIYVSAFLWKDWGGYWAIPARGGEMLEVTLP